MPGACLVAVGMFLFVFALSEGARYGWFRPLETFAIAGADGVARRPRGLVHPARRSWSRRRSSSRSTGSSGGRSVTTASPLFEFGQLRHRGFRYGLITTSVLAMGQMGMFFVLPVFLQDAKHLSAETNGFWMLPVRRVHRRRVAARRLPHPPHRAWRVSCSSGSCSSSSGSSTVALVVDPGDDASSTCSRPYGLFGFGIGFASSQLTNVILSDIPAEKAGVASGTNSTVRQVGAALGVAVIGSVFASLTVQRTIDAVKEAAFRRRFATPRWRACTRRVRRSRCRTAWGPPTPPR